MNRLRVYLIFHQSFFQYKPQFVWDRGMLYVNQLYKQIHSFSKYNIYYRLQLVYVRTLQVTRHHPW